MRFLNDCSISSVGSWSVKSSMKEQALLIRKFAKKDSFFVFLALLFFYPLSLYPCVCAPSTFQPLP